MKNETNIYDIDGEIIRKAEDDHKMTVEEASDKIEYYRKKILEVGEEDPKAIMYATYMRNLSQYIMRLYAQMTPEQLNAQIEKAKAQKDLDKQVKEAIEELQKQINNDGDVETNPITEVSSTTTDNSSDTNGTLGDDETEQRADSNIHEERPVSQEDILVDREVNDTVMDEYAQFEEIEPVTVGGENDGTND